MTDRRPFHTLIGGPCEDSGLFPALSLGASNQLRFQHLGHRLVRLFVYLFVDFRLRSNNKLKRPHTHAPPPKIC